MIDINEMVLVSGSAIAAFVACLLGTPLAIRLSRAVGLVDHPTSRKNHLVATPVVGGVSIFLALALVSAMFAREWLNISMMGWVAIVVMLGVYDDIAELSAVKRLVVHAAIILGVYITDGLAVFSIGDVVGQGVVYFTAPVAIALTVIAVLGAVNAVNMIDGVDGLLGSLAFVTFFTLLVIAIGAQASGFAYKSFTLVDIASMLGALSAFLLFNSRFFKLNRAIVFMGDAGSTAIGFCLVFLLIDFSQGSTPLISPVAAGWILGLPLLDASAVIGIRILRGKSPFRPGRDHIHHLFIDNGISVNTAVGVLVLVHCLLVLVGVTGKLLFGGVADMIMFWGFVVLVFVRIMHTESLVKIVRRTVRRPDARSAC